MPKCRNCYAPIIFLTERPEIYNAGTWDKPLMAIREVRPVPIDINPDPDGNIAIYEFPSPFFDPLFTGERKRYIRKLEPSVKKLFQTGWPAGVTYRNHFETCPAKR